MKYRHVSILRRVGGTVAVVRLERPEAHNALNGRARDELADAARAVLNDESVGALVLAGTERAFSVGADIREEGTTYTPADFESYVREYERANAWYELLSRYPKPIVAGLTGYAAGAGLQLALCADVIIGSPTLTIWIPQVGLGLSPHTATLVKLSGVIGRQRALRLALTGERANADDALRWGLISEVVDTESVLDRAVEVAHAIARQPPIAVRLTKQAFQAASGQQTDLTRLLDELKSFGMSQSQSWQRKREELLDSLGSGATKR